MDFNPHKIISNRMEDINDLIELVKEETNPDIILIWRYHLALDSEVINCIMRKDFIMALTLINEIQRSLSITAKYLITFYPDEMEM